MGGLGSVCVCDRVGDPNSSRNGDWDPLGEIFVIITRTKLENVFLLF